MELLQGILTRTSHPKLVAPAPQGDALTQVLRCALRAPDHGRMKPWRFFVIEGESLHKLGEAFEQATRLDSPDADQASLDRARNMPLRAPMIITIAASVQPNPKVPYIEQIIATGAAVQNLQLALHALGFGSMWRTGAMASHPHIKAFFRLKSEDEIVAFLYVGSQEGEPKPSLELELEKYVEFLS